MISQTAAADLSLRLDCRLQKLTFQEGIVTSQGNHNYREIFWFHQESFAKLEFFDLLISL